MIGDIILVSDKDYRRAEKVLKEIKNEKIILIGGSSGTAKSELAYSIQKLLNDNNKKSSFVVSLDDYYNTIASVRAINRKKLGLDSVGLSEIDFESLQRIYEDFQNQREIHFKRTHRFLDAVEHNILESNIDYLIIEGLYANYLRKWYNDNFSVFLEGSPQQTLEFRKKRGKENEEDSFRVKVVEKEYRVTVQLKRYSDLIIPFEEK